MLPAFSGLVVVVRWPAILDQFPKRIAMIPRPLKIYHLHPIFRALSFPGLSSRYRLFSRVHTDPSSRRHRLFVVLVVEIGFQLIFHRSIRTIVSRLFTPSPLVVELRGLRYSKGELPNHCGWVTGCTIGLVRICAGFPAESISLNGPTIAQRNEYGRSYYVLLPLDVSVCIDIALRIVQVINIILNYLHIWRSKYGSQPRTRLHVCTPILYTSSRGSSKACLAAFVLFDCGVVTLGGGLAAGISATSWRTNDLISD
jgi:hypothetical protein